MKRKLRVLLLGFVVIASGCATLPPPQDRVASSALTDTAGTRIGRAVAPRVAGDRTKTGIHSLPDPRDAFAARVLLANAAEKSLDAQYYIWSADQAGDLLFEAVWEAAERGVRVRLLLDDLNTKGVDSILATLDAHPNIEVRLYNPLAGRNARALNFLTDFSRLNRRMHNKSFTVDNQATVLGGRNIANEYFGAGGDLTYADLDVLAIGQAVADVSNQFDLYWSSASAYPASAFVGPSAADGARDLVARFAANRADPGSVAYLEAIRTTPLVREILEGALQFDWTTSELLYDDPAKTLDTTERTDVLLFPALLRKMGPAEKTLDIVSPYFIPGVDGTALLVSLAKRGVAVRVLTNSLAASEAKSVHSGYAKRRRELLAAGVRLYEMKPTARESERSGDRFGSGSSSGLHAKTLAVDNRRIFVGSFNLDPRSARLNTELGLVVTDPKLAHGLTQFFDVEVPGLAYEVRLRGGGSDLEWIERTPTGEKRFETEPGSTWATRAAVELLSILPIDWML